jgi:hypothetical protein
MTIAQIGRLALWVVAAFAGCASAPPLYGNFLERTSVETQSLLAQDAAAQLRRAYSPASIPLWVPESKDPFGQALVTRLRRMGFSVSDERNGAPANTLTVRYVVDALGSQFYCVSLVIWRARDSALISRMNRAYGLQSGVMHPAGAWTRLTAADKEAQAWTTN